MTTGGVASDWLIANAHRLAISVVAANRHLCFHVSVCLHCQGLVQHGLRRPITMRACTVQDIRLIGTQVLWQCRYIRPLILLNPKGVYAAKSSNLLAIIGCVIRSNCLGPKWSRIYIGTPKHYLLHPLQLPWRNVARKALWFDLVLIFG